MKHLLRLLLVASSTHLANSLSLLGSLQCPTLILSNTTTPSLNLTSITTRDGISVLECWNFPSFIPSSGAGTVGGLNLALGDFASVTFTVLPPRFDGGLHRAPANQLVAFLSGVVHITLPNSTDEAWITGGKFGLIVAADRDARDGHISRYPSAEDTVALQIPFAGGVVSEHEFIHGGPCRWEEMIGI